MYTQAKLFSIHHRRSRFRPHRRRPPDPVAFGLPWGGMSIAWPILMTCSLLWITGVPWAEAQALASRGKDYRDYQRETSVFFPWFPRTER